ncbi:hypothetical protein IL306_012886 [Fusarium sp. DS 682]|nr:hypothetical protein IL306_012886 [Fusarium sp. DS 682]
MSRPQHRLSVDILTATATELAVLLEQGKTTSVELTQAYLRQIHLHNEKGAKLKSIISIVPEDKLLKTASRLDRERAEGKSRSLFHGIPIVVKDTIWTDPSFGLPTTSGTLALKNAVARQNAHVLQKTPGGSSSGSAVAVAAGMAPIALGTETDGSICVPSDRAGLYSLKFTVGKVSTKGLLPYTHVTDSLGPMTKSPADVATLLDILTPIHGGTHHDALRGSFKGLRIGFLDPAEWAPGPGAVRPNEDYTKQTFPCLIQIMLQMEEVEGAVKAIEKAGAVVKRNVKLRRFSSDDDKMFNDLASRDYVIEFAEYLRGLDHTPVHTMKELVEFNDQHMAECFPPDSGAPGQEILSDAVKTHLSDEKYEEYKKALLTNNKDHGIDKTLKDYDVDVIIGTPTGRMITVAALAGYPIGTLPLGYARFNGRPFGLAVIAPANAETLALSVMSAWEATFPQRKPPPQLCNWGEEHPKK